MLYNITNIVYNHLTDIYPLLNINIYINVQVGQYIHYLAAPSARHGPPLARRRAAIPH